MITHEQLLDEWEQDSQIDRFKLDQDAVNTPSLHHKYLRMYMDIKAKKIAFTHKIEEMKKDLELYYSGQATADVYKAKPFDTRLKTKTGVEKHINTDPDILAIRTKIEYSDILLEGIQHILTQIQWRNQHVKNAIEFMKWQSGEM